MIDYDSILSNLVDSGYIKNEDCYYTWYIAKDFPDLYKIKKPTKIRLIDHSRPYYEELEPIIWLGTLGELGTLATILYGRRRWDVIRYYYTLPGGKCINIRSIQSKIANEIIEVKYKHIYNLCGF